MKKATIVFIIFLSGNSAVFAQTNYRIMEMMNLNMNTVQRPPVMTKLPHVPFSAAEHKPDFSIAKRNKNAGESVFSFLFWSYKNFVSSQDGISCAFTPSCSEFGLAAVKKKGIIPGIFITFDRLNRCHGLSQEKYSYHTHLLYDPL